jgi:hypothetical protein
MNIDTTLFNNARQSSIIFYKLLHLQLLFLNSFIMFWLIICMHLFQVHLDVFFFTKIFIFSCDKLPNSKKVLALMGDLIISICEKGTIAHSQVYLNIYEA